MKKNILFWVVLLSFVYASIEGLSLVSLYFFKHKLNITYSPLRTDSLWSFHRDRLSQLINNSLEYGTFSPTLGWTIKKNGDDKKLYKANSQGIRADREYQFKPESGVVRISAFGDSLTHCDEVSNQYTWEEFMNRFNPSFEVINFGVGGYGLDQAYLRYLEDGIIFNSHIVLIGYMAENINRNMNTYRPFYLPGTGGPLSKPRFIVKNDELMLIKNPIQHVSKYMELLQKPEIFLPELGRHDYFYKTRYKKGLLDFLPSIRLFKIIYSEFIGGKIIRSGDYNNKEAFNVTTKIFNEFYKTVLRNGSLPIIVVFPTEPDIKKGEKMYASLLNYFDRKGFMYIDLMDILGLINPDELMKKGGVFRMRGGHFSPTINAMVARRILSYLRENNLININSINSNVVDLKKKMGY